MLILVQQMVLFKGNNISDVQMGMVSLHLSTSFLLLLVLCHLKCKVLQLTVLIRQAQPHPAVL